MKKSYLSVLMATVLTVSMLTGCGSKNENVSADANADALARIQQKGKITVAMEGTWAPWTYHDENDKLVGFDVEVAQQIADKLGVEAEFVQMDFDSVLIGIQAAKYDCAMSGITVTPDREKNMLFTDPYYNAAQVIVVAEGSPITGKADLAGKVASVQTGTTAESGCQDEGIEVQAFAANADAKAALTTGKVDAWVVDNLTAMQMVEEGDGLVILEEKMTEEPYAFAFAMGSEDLVAAINEALAELIADGTVQSIIDKYIKAD